MPRRSDNTSRDDKRKAWQKENHAGAARKDAGGKGGEEMKWVKVTDRLPGATGSFLVYNAGSYSVCLFDVQQNAFYFHGSYSVKAEYWARITNPKDDDDD